MVVWSYGRLETARKDIIVKLYEHNIILSVLLVGWMYRGGTGYLSCSIET